MGNYESALGETMMVIDQRGRNAVSELRVAPIFAFGIP